MKKIISLLLAVAMCLTPMSLALASGDNWMGAFDPTPGNLPQGINGTVNNVLGAIQTIGYVVAIIMVMYVGIKYLTAGASKKAEAKETLIPILVGAILIVAATTIVKWLWGIGV